MHNRSKILSNFFVWLGAAFALFLLGCEQAKPLANVTKVSGGVKVKVSANDSFKDAKDNDGVQNSGAIRTEVGGIATLVFADKSEILLKPESYFEVTQGSNLGNQKEGTILYQIQKQDKGEITVQTPQGVTAILGTTFIMTVASDSCTIFLEKGSVSFKSGSGGGKVVLSPGQKLVAPAIGKLPAPQEMDPFEVESLFRGSKLPGINQR